MSEEKIIDKIQKLLALAGNNPNPHEAEQALKSAHKMLLKHNLSIEDVDITDERLVIRLTATWYGAPWVRSLAGAVGKLYFCRVFTQDAPRGQKVYNFIGTQSNTEVAKDIAHWLTYAIYREGRRQDKEARQKGFHTAFCRSATIRIEERVNLIIDEAKEEQADVYGGTSTALVVADYYKTTAEENEDFMSGLGIRFRKTRTSSRGGRVQQGRAAGYDYGNSLSLNRQVSGAGQRRLK
jgi:hypothetical protein